MVCVVWRGAARCGVVRVQDSPHATHGDSDGVQARHEQRGYPMLGGVRLATDDCKHLLVGGTIPEATNQLAPLGFGTPFDVLRSLLITTYLSYSRSPAQQYELNTYRLANPHDELDIPYGPCVHFGFRMTGL